MKEANNASASVVGATRDFIDSNSKDYYLKGCETCGRCACAAALDDALKYQGNFFGVLVEANPGKAQELLLRAAENGCKTTEIGGDWDRKHNLMYKGFIRDFAVEAAIEKAKTLKSGRRAVK